MYRYSPGRFEMYKADSGALRFKIKHSGAYGQGMLSLLSKPRPHKVLYDIIIGPVFVIMTIRTGTVQREIRAPLPDPIGLTFTEFWITWYGYVLRMGIGSHTEPLLIYRGGCSLEFNIGFIQFDMRASNIHPVPVQWEFEASPVKLRDPVEKVFDDDLQWKDMIIEERDGVLVTLLPNGAMIGGYEYEPIYIARTELFGSLCIGKYVPSQDNAFFPYAENVHVVRSIELSFQILCGMNAKWVKTRGNYIPENALVGGHSEVRNEPLYVGRAMYDNCLLVGKVNTLYSACYLPYRGEELCVREYEILIKPNYKYRGKLLRQRRQRNDVDRTRSAEVGREQRELAGNQRRPIPVNQDLMRWMNGRQVGVQAPEQPARGGPGVPPRGRVEAIVRAALDNRRHVMRRAANIIAQYAAFPQAHVRAQVYARQPFRGIQREHIAPERLNEVPAQANPPRGQEVPQVNPEQQEMAQNAEAEPQRNQENAQHVQPVPMDVEAQRDYGIEQPAGEERIPPEGQGIPQDLGRPQEGQEARRPQEGQAAQRPQEAQAAQRPQEGQAAQIPQEAQAAQRPQEGQAAQIPQEAQAAQRPQEGQAAQIPQEGQAAQRPQEGQAAQIPQEAQAAQRPQEAQAAQRSQEGQAAWRPQEAQAAWRQQEAQAAWRPQEAQAAQRPQEGQAAWRPQEAQAAQIPQEAQAAQIPQEAQAAWRPQEAQAAQIPQEAQAAWRQQEAQAAWRPQEAQAAQRPQEAQAAWRQQEAQAAWIPQEAQAAQRPQEGQAAWRPQEAQAAQIPQEAQAAWRPQEAQAAWRPQEAQAARNLRGFHQILRPLNRQEMPQIRLPPNADEQDFEFALELERAAVALAAARRIGPQRAVPLEVYEGRVVVPPGIAQVEHRPVAGNQAQGMPPPPAYVAVPPAQPAVPPAQAAPVRPARRAFRDEFVAYIQRDWIPIPD